MINDKIKLTNKLTWWFAKSATSTDSKILIRGWIYFWILLDIKHTKSSANYC